MISVGIPAPPFSLPDSNGDLVSLSDFKGKRVLLIFYPGDNTPVCTAQLCSYRDNFSVLDSLGITVLGISTDSVQSHKGFMDKYAFPFTLLSDTTKATARAYDALGFFGVMQRAYCLIDEGGIVRYSLSETLPIFYRSAAEIASQIQSLKA
jgi:thioredoxin-dependent peroxiredoxin